MVHQRLIAISSRVYSATLQSCLGGVTEYITRALCQDCIDKIVANTRQTVSWTGDQPFHNQLEVLEVDSPSTFIYFFISQTELF